MSKLVLGYIGMGRDGGGENVAPFNKLFTHRVNLMAPDAFEKVNAVVIWGGTDIHPSMYRQKAHANSQVRGYPEPSNRDKIEWHIMKEALQRKKMIIGVCRGAQMACALAGGSLYQDVSGHKGGHQLQTYDGEIFYAQAQHHQMMNLDNTENEVLAWPYTAPKDSHTKPMLKLSNYYEREQVGVDEPGTHLLTGVEPEVVWFPEVKAFGVQAHPEWAQGEDHPFVKWTLKEIEKRL